MHTCPWCGADCYCGNDLDDICLGEGSATGCCHACDDGPTDDHDFEPWCSACASLPAGEVCDTCRAELDL